MFCIGLVLFSRVSALVGGNYANSVKAGLWYWNCWDNSSIANTNIGARLIILKIHIKGFGVFSASVLHYSILF